jgi:hypothetical protein
MDILPFDNFLFIFGIGLQIILGIAFADFVSGTLHWLEDSYGKEEWPILGPYVIEPNIHHHYKPLDFVRGTYWNRNRSVLVIAALVGLLFLGAGWINVFTVTALIVGSQANEIHRWAHMPTKDVPKFLQRVQKTGLLLGSFHHWRHHTGRLDSHYCTVTNFVNPILDRLKLFRAIERMIWIVTNYSPRDRKILA